MELISSKDDIRANAVGGTCQPVTMTHEEDKTAIEIAKLFHLEDSGIDLIRSNDGTRILEINADPRFETHEKTTGINVADYIIDYLEKRNTS